MANGNETIALPAGETWMRISEKTETREFPGSGGTCTVKFVTKETFYNAGILEKSRIREG